MCVRAWVRLSLCVRECVWLSLCEDAGDKEHARVAFACARKRERKCVWEQAKGCVTRDGTHLAALAQSPRRRPLMCSTPPCGES